MIACKLDYEFSNDFRFVETLIYIFARTQAQEISIRECEILREYVLRGYSNETKNHIQKALGIKPTNLNVYNCNLQKKGLLKPHPKKQNNKVLNEELLKIRQFYEEASDKKVLLINFLDKNR